MKRCEGNCCFKGRGVLPCFRLLWSSYGGSDGLFALPNAVVENAEALSFIESTIVLVKGFEEGKSLGVGREYFPGELAEHNRWIGELKREVERVKKGEEVGFSSSKDPMSDSYLHETIFLRGDIGGLRQDTEPFIKRWRKKHLEVQSIQ